MGIIYINFYISSTVSKAILFAWVDAFSEHNIKKKKLFTFAPLKNAFYRSSSGEKLTLKPDYKLADMNFGSLLSRTRTKKVIDITSDSFPLTDTEQSNLLNY